MFWYEDCFLMKFILSELTESRLERGWIGKSEIYKLWAQLQAGISVRNIIDSEREGENKSTKEIERMTQWFVLPRFGYCKPTPRWGGHKDRVSFNPFPLSNGHLDRVSFSSQSIETLSPHKDHHTIGVSCFDYKDLGNKKWGRRRKVIQAQELKEHGKTLSSSH